MNNKCMISTNQNNKLHQDAIVLGNSKKLWKFKKLPNPHAKDNYKLMLTEYLGDDSVVVIPKSINGHEVTQIGRNVFYRNENITGVIIPDSITNIGVFRKNIEIPAFAFFDCAGLTIIKIPATVIKIGEWSFF